MDRNQWAKIAQKIVDAYRDPFTEEQFELWFNQFRSEGFNLANRACDEMIGEFKYFPTPATYRSYLDRIKEQDKAKAEATRKVRADPNLLCNMSPEEKEAEFKRRQRFSWFLRWCAERRKFPKLNGDYQTMQKDFDENHKDWKPKKQREQKGIQKIREVVGDAIGNLDT